MYLLCSRRGSPVLGPGTALARTLFGEVNPSGKLVVSWPRSVGQEPLYYNALNTGRPTGDTDLTHPPATADERYLSRYIDEQNSPQFPFGYGASYTTFVYGSTTVSKSKLSAAILNKNLNDNAETVLRVEADVSNTGSRPGDEIVAALHSTARDKYCSTCASIKRLPARCSCSGRNEESDV